MVPPLALPPAETTETSELAGSDAVSVVLRARWRGPTSVPLDGRGHASRRQHLPSPGRHPPGARAGRRPNARCSPSPRSPIGSITASSCSAGVRAPLWPGSRRYGRPWTGAMRCCLPPNRRRCVGWRCSRSFRHRSGRRRGERQVRAASADWADLIGRLVDRSLVVCESTGDDVRYRLLEPIRQYAAEKLTEAGEVELVGRRHRDVFLARAAAWAWIWTRRRPSGSSSIGSTSRQALEWSWQAHDIGAALTLCVMARNLRVLGQDPREWFERALAEANRRTSLSGPEHWRSSRWSARVAEPDAARSARLMHEATSWRDGWRILC